MLSLQSPFKPVVMFLLTQLSKAEARQSFPSGDMRCCWTLILGKELLLNKMCLCPFEDLGFS